MNMSEQSCEIDIIVEAIRHSLACLIYNNRKGKPDLVLKYLPALNAQVKAIEDLAQLQIAETSKRKDAAQCLLPLANSPSSDSLPPSPSP